MKANVQMYANTERAITHSIGNLAYAAINKLVALINEVKPQRGKKLMEEQADELIEAAK